MKRAQVIGISIALGAGLIAFAGMRSLTKPPKPVVQMEKVNVAQVLVARADIGLGHVATESNFRWQDWPADAVGGPFITKANKPTAARDFTGSIARAPMLAGEPVTENKLIKPGSGGVLAAILPAGMRAISTKITEVSAAGKLILPNDRVDVILTLRGTGSGSATQSETLFENIRVLAVGQQIEAREGKKNAEGNVATLELTPSQAESLASANMRGEISLALRSIVDLGGATERKHVRVLRLGGGESHN